MLPNQVTTHLNPISSIDALNLIDGPVFVKKQEAAGKTLYGVQGLSPVTAHELTVSHQPAAKNTIRSLARIDLNTPISGSTTGAFSRDTIYLVLHGRPEATAAEKEALVNEIVSVIATSEFLTAFVNAQS